MWHFEVSLNNNFFPTIIVSYIKIKNIKVLFLMLKLIR